MISFLTVQCQYNNSHQIHREENSRMKAIKLLLLIVITTITVSCNSKKIRTTEKNSIENAQKADYPPPSENAAEVQIEEIAINPQPLATENINLEKSSRSERPSLDYNLQNQTSLSSEGPMNNTRLASPMEQYTDNSELHLPERTNLRESHFKKSQNNIGRIELEEQKEYERESSATGATGSVFSSSSGTSRDNIGPKINIGTKVRKESPDGSNQGEIFQEHSGRRNGTDLGKIYSRAESSTLSEPEFPMSSEGAENKNPLAGYEPPKEPLSKERNDDIVARQIQEAASAEQDPALREKLWKEYERYRSGL